MTSSAPNTGLILREQSDTGQTIAQIAKLLEKISMLWQIPNWTPQNSVLLAEWVFDTYQFEPLEVILRCLNTPRVDDEKVYRLTPDVITKWMTEQLEKEAVKREKENQRMKEDFKTALPHIDYEAYKKRIEDGLALNESKPKHWSKDPGYQAFKAERMAKQAQQKPEEKQ